MSAKKTNIEQIHKYLNGELDAHAMYELERRAHSDPFLWDAIKGAEKKDADHDANLSAIDRLISERVEKGKKRIIPLWQSASVAASLLVALGIGGWYLMSHQNTAQPVIATVVKKADIKPQLNSDTLPVVTRPVVPLVKQPIIAKLNTGKVYNSKSSLPSAVLASATPLPAAVQYTTDTVKYNASAYPVKDKATVDAMLKKMPGIDVGADGTVTHQGQQVTKVRINGKDYLGGSVAQATKNLPADVVQSIQVIDDYGDQASNTFKTPDPDKVLNIVTRNNAKGKTSTSADLLKKLSALEADSALQGRSIANLQLRDKAYFKTRGDSASMYSQSILGKVAGAQVTTPDRKSREMMEQVTGHVMDADNKIGLPGAAISVLGSQATTQTDANGKFTIALPSGKDVLSVGYIGYNNQQVKVKGRDSLNVTLSPNSSSLNEVVVTGYGTVKQEAVKFTPSMPTIGWKAYNKYLDKNAVMPAGSTGTINLSFIISGDGKLSNITIIKGLADDINQKAIKLIQDGSAWTGSSDRRPQLINISIKFHK